MNYERMLRKMRNDSRLFGEGVKADQCHRIIVKCKNKLYGSKQATKKDPVWLSAYNQ